MVGEMGLGDVWEKWQVFMDRCEYLKAFVSWERDRKTYISWNLTKGKKSVHDQMWKAPSISPDQTSTSKKIPP